MQFERIVLTQEYLSEGAAVGDFDRDGELDVVSGPYWYEGPGFQIRHALFPPVPKAVITYTETSFLNYVEDLDGDGWEDVFVIAFPGTSACWYRNPAGQTGLWSKHLVFDGVDGESPALLDVDGDGVTELLCGNGGLLGYAERNPLDPRAPWTFRRISDPALSFVWHVFFHGLGPR